ncbi:MAG: DEAD/DEAH box helicase [Oscillospiraceae bacterium]|nr:DEAD/DEAH box helicase [Oscillospiraceae bacterium]
MNAQELHYFHQLSEHRSGLADALDDPALRGVKSSVVEKYSDQAHFVYELLQNADDAKATSARFVLYKDKLVFAHNGTRRFNVSNPSNEEEDSICGKLGDINSITSIANSNKKEASIGKFGVGFKAVFQYTTTPHIYDPNICFKIERFIVPSHIESDYPGRKEDETLFVFPFDHTDRGADEAYEDISEKLKALDYPLLFLSCLQDISFDVAGHFGLYGKVITQTHKIKDTKTQIDLICLSQNDGDDIYEDMLWLFSRTHDSALTYSIGYFVDDTGTLIPKSHAAYCFFPTKEKTGLNFIIHAPFLLTDSREGIRAGVVHNKNMINLLADLAADSLVYLKNIGLSNNRQVINDEIFDIIPYDEGLFPEGNERKEISFRPFYSVILNVMGTEELLPAVDGYISSENAYWADVPQIANLFTNEQLAMMSNNNKAKWTFTSFGRQETSRKYPSLKNYIDSITKTWLDEDDIINGWSLKDSNIFYGGLNSTFINNQCHEWLHKLYKWLSETSHRTELSIDKPIFINQDNKAVAAFDKDREAILFLPTDDDTGYDTINEALLDNNDTLSFINKLGIKTPSLRDEIYNKILPLYTDGKGVNTAPHFKKFFSYYLECLHTEVDSFLHLICDLKFVLYRTLNDEKQYRGEASSIYFPSEELKLWFTGNDKTRFLSYDDYLDMVGKDKETELRRFLTDIGISNTPRVIQRDIDYREAMQINNSWPHSTRGKRWTERYIDGSKELFDIIIEQHRSDLSITAWQILSEVASIGYLNNNSWSYKSVLYGRYEYFYRSSLYEAFESTEAKRLRTAPWLLDTNGNFTSATYLTIGTLNKKYNTSIDGTAELLEILRISEKHNDTIEEHDDNLSDEQKAKIEFANKYSDVPAEILEIAAMKYRSKNLNDEEQNQDIDENVNNDVNPDEPTVSRLIKDIEKRTIIHGNIDAKDANISHSSDEENNDEDDYTKPIIDYNKKIEQAKQKSAKEIDQILQLEQLTQKASSCIKYTYEWFMTLLELESINSADGNSRSREISISFSKVEREPDSTRTLVLKHPNRHIPNSMEELADIPLELHFHDSPPKRLAIEVVSVKSYTLRAKLKTNAEVDGIDLSLVKEARIDAKNPIFLLEELKKALSQLEYSNNYNMQRNLCKNINFVFGPPGTGKTTYLATNVIIPIMRDYEDKRILVLTPTNKAADVLVSRVMDVMGDDNSYVDWLIRFGATNDDEIERSGVFRDKTFDIRNMQKNVTVSTIHRFPYDYFMPDADTRLHLDALMWDFIIIDEASMIPIINMIYPLFKKTPEKFIIAGDPFQIGPITTVDMWENENIYTMVELESFVEPATKPHSYHVELLTTQYRSIPTIGEIFSNFAYGGVLKHNRTEDSRVHLGIDNIIDDNSICIIKFPVSKYESIHKPKKLKGKSNYQVYSAILAFEFAQYLSNSLKKPDDINLLRIGIIAPYRAQADLIDKLMKSATHVDGVDIQAGTIHGFQGDECHIIISVFNPPPSITTSQQMFLNRRNIINVSISRAKDYLFIIMPDDNTNNVNNLKLIKYVEALSKRNKHTLINSTDIEDVIWNNSSYIEDNSFATSHQIVNVYGEPEHRYEVRSEEDAVDIQIHNTNETQKVIETVPADNNHMINNTSNAQVNISNSSIPQPTITDPAQLKINHKGVNIEKFRSWDKYGILNPTVKKLYEYLFSFADDQGYITNFPDGFSINTKDGFPLVWDFAGSVNGTRRIVPQIKRLYNKLKTHPGVNQVKLERLFRELSGISKTWNITGVTTGKQMQQLIEFIILIDNRIQSVYDL